MSRTCCGPERLGRVLDARLFKALCHPTRTDLVMRLACCGGSGTVGEVSEQVPVSLSVVSRGLAQLREAGVVSAERQGKVVCYRLRCGELANLLRELADCLEACCPNEGENHERGDEELLREGA